MKTILLIYSAGYKTFKFVYYLCSLILLVLTHLQPSKGNHSVTEASLALFLVHPIVDFSKYNNLITDNLFISKYVSYSPKIEKKLVGTIDAVNDIVITEGSSPLQEVGFIIESFNAHGQPSFTINADMGKANVISFHNLDYQGWELFLKRYQDDFNVVSKVQQGLYINNIGLAYVDHFIWNNNSFPPMNEIFIENDYMPKRLLEAKNEWDYSFTAHADNIDGMNIAENIRMNVKKMPNSSYLLTLFHNAVAVLKKPSEFTPSFITGQCTEVSNALHIYNKRFLAACLTQEVCKKINLEPQL